MQPAGNAYGGLIPQYFRFGPMEAHFHGHSALEWRRPLDDWLADIAKRIFQTDPFRIALIGHEVSGDTEAASLGGSVPEQRFISYLLPHDGRLDYAPANR